MKKLIPFAVAATAVCGSAGVAQAQTVAPLPVMAQPASLFAGPTLSGSLLGFLQAEQIPGTRQASTNFTSIAQFDFTLRPDLVFTFSPRVDWVNQEPGVFKSQYSDIKDLSLNYKISPSSNIIFGTLPYWGGFGSEPSLTNKSTQVPRGFLGLGFGGPNPGLVGFDARFNGVFANGMNYRFETMLGTGDRFINPSILGADFPVLCGDLTKRGCGVIGGANLTISPFKGLDLNVQQTYLGNGFGLSDEWISTLGARYKYDIGKVTFGGLFNSTWDEHYLGTPQGLKAFTESLSMQTPLTDRVGLNAYVSATQARNAVYANYWFAGLGLTYQKDKDASYTVAPYVGRETISGKNYSGIWASFTRFFGPE